MPSQDLSPHLIIGAGAVGKAVARLLASRGQSSTVVSRSGTTLSDPLIRSVKMDAADERLLSKLAVGAPAIYNCANPPYSKWTTDWPPLASSLLKAAEISGAVLATASNLYMYSAPSRPMTEDSETKACSRKGQVRLNMWEGALESHRAGRARITEARGSDYLGAGVGQNGHMGDRVIPKLLAGKSVSVVGDPDAPHSWTAVDDMAETLVTIAAKEEAWGRAWHVPTAPPLSARDLVNLFCSEAGIDPVSVKQTPRFILKLLGYVVPDVREIDELFYQFDQPFVIDSSAFTDHFEMEATPIEQTIRDVIAHYRA